MVCAAMFLKLIVLRNILHKKRMIYKLRNFYVVFGEDTVLNGINKNNNKNISYISYSSRVLDLDVSIEIFYWK